MFDYSRKPVKWQVGNFSKNNYSSSSLVITSIEVTSDYTCLNFRDNNKSGEDTWYNIYPKAFIRDKNTGKKYSLIKAVNCAMAPQRSTIAKGETIHFSLYFQAIPEETKLIDFVEFEGTAWSVRNISNIELESVKTTSQTRTGNNRNNETIKYSFVDSFNDGIACVRYKGRYGFIDKAGREIVPCIYSYACSFVDGLACVRINDKWGFIDKTGRMVIPCQYDYACSFCEGLACVKLNDKYGFIDKTGKRVIPIIYDYANSFNQGLATVEYNGHYGVVKKTGKYIQLK